MKRFLPSSLFGQVMVSVALALLVAQIVSAVLLYRATEDRREASLLTAAAFQLIQGAERAERRRALDFERRRGPGPGALGRREAGLPGALPRPLRYSVTGNAPVPLASEGTREERLRSVLLQEGVDPHRVAIGTRRAGEDPLLLAFAETRERFERRGDWRERRLLIAAIQREPDGQWEAVRILDPPRPKAALGVLMFQTLVTFTVLLVVLFLVLRRITRPLGKLTERVSSFSQRPDQAVQLEESGPADMRRLIAAHNMMESRIAALLDEKDVMLGAIGHDLKTPLAALRVRIESVADESQRAKMAESIEDITATLDDILSLARVGRADALDTEAVDLGALAIAIGEEFEDLGEPITVLEPPEGSARIVAGVQVTWIKRAVRNLVSNAVRYGEKAEISVLSEGSHAIIRIDDSGPGIAEDRIEAMMEPFTRGEASRNRTTGGAGLGLTLARAIAEQHGGTLVLANRSETGLRAELRLPL